MKLLFKKPTPSDIKQLQVIEVLCFNTDRLSRRSFLHHLKSPSSIFISLKDNEHIIGYGLVFTRKNSRRARLYSLAIHPNYRGQNYGKQLLLHLEKKVLGKAKIFFELEVKTSNKRAISLYKHMGFENTKTLPSYYQDGTDALKFSKKLTTFR